MTKRHSTIQGKLMRVIMLTSGAVLLMACAAFFTFEYFTGREVKKRQLRTIGEIIANSSADALMLNKKAGAEEILHILRSQKNIVGACLYDMDGNIFAVYPANFKPLPKPPAIVAGDYRFAGGFLIGYQPVVENDTQLGIVYMKANMDDVQQRFLLYGGIAVVFITISFITAFLFSKYLQHSITAPILELADVARTVSDNKDYSLRTVKRTEDEVGDLTDAFNHMLIEIERQNGEINTLNHNLELKVKARTTELEDANIILKQQTELVENIIDSSVDLIAVFDTELRYRVLNKASEKIYGKDLDLIGKKLVDAFPHVRTSGMLDSLHKAFTGETVRIATYRSGVTLRYYEHFYIPIKDKNDKVYLVLTIAHDITDIMEANEKLVDVNKELAKSNEELEQFAYIASHDLQEPLRKIQTFSELSIKNIGDLPTLTRYLEKINASGQRMTELIKAVLNYSRVAKSNELFVDVDLNASLDNILSDLELLIEEKQAVIKRSDMPVVKAIPLQMNQLFSNLVTNALKFSDKPPEIKILYSVKTPEQITNVPNVKTGTDYAEIIFRDNGIGFDSRFSDKIFSIFQRLHQDKNVAGTGIGLAVCKRIVENHHGYIGVESDPGIGTTFFIYLPITVNFISPEAI